MNVLKFSSLWYLLNILRIEYLEIYFFFDNSKVGVIKVNDIKIYNL